jgi:ribonuclease P protein component
LLLYLGMLKKYERLSRTEFEIYFKKGKRFHSEQLTVVFVPHTSFHASVVVGKKVSKKAVIRNTLRRRVYGILYTKKQRNIRGIWIVVLKPSMLLLTKQQAKTQVENLIERVVKTA